MAGFDAPALTITYEDYASCVPEGNRYKLDKEVDFEHGRVQKHLMDIADLLLNWELAAPSLGLSPIEISDVQSNNRTAAMQR